MNVPGLEGNIVQFSWLVVFVSHQQGGMTTDIVNQTPQPRNVWGGLGKPGLI